MIVKQRYNIMLNPNIVQILDKVARNKFTSRSDVIGDILSSYIVENDLMCSSDFDTDIPGQEVFND